MRASKSVLRRSFIGLDVKVVKSSHPNYTKVSGTIIDETKKNFSIRQGDVVKRIPKQECIFHITLPSGEVVEVNGRLILYRPEDRVGRS